MGVIRRGHWLKDNKRTAYPSEFIFFDTETSPYKTETGDIEQPFKLGVALYWRRRPEREQDTSEYLHFDNVFAFWQWVCEKPRRNIKIVMVAHNLQFDFLVLDGFHHLKERGWKISKIIINGRTNIYKFRKRDTSLLFLDNYNYFNMNIKSLGDCVNLPKLDMPSQDASLSEWFTYCQRDVEIMFEAWKFWLKYLKDNDLGYFGMTLASQCFNAFRHRFMSIPLLIHDNLKAIELERLSYRGGRNEAYFIGKLPVKPYRMLDVNSMYPYVMQRYKYPTRLVGVLDEISPDRLEHLLRHFCVIAEVTLNTKSNAYGIKRNGKLIFPVGKFRAYLTTEELKFALMQKDIVKIYRANIYERNSIFKDYVNFFWNERQRFFEEGNTVYQTLAKNFLNSLYGKFGQRNEVWEYVGDDSERDFYIETEINAQTNEVYTLRCINGQVYQTKGKIEAYNSFPAVSSEVTANARLILYRLMQSPSIEVYYCDTDSLLVDKERSNLLPILSTRKLELGGLKVEKESSNVIIFGCKDYIFGKTHHHKGVPENAIPSGLNTFVTYPQIGVRLALRNGRVNRMTWRKVEKHLKRTYEKGVIQEDGSVEPFELNED